MKKLFVFLLIFLVAGAWLGQMMVQDPGYVLLAYKQTTIETSLWVLLLLLIVGFALGHWLLNLIAGARLPGAKVRNWQSRRSQRISQKKTLKGMVALSEGNWWKAQRFLSQAAERSDLPAINYMAAARAAQEQGDSTGADALLQRAREATPEAEVAIGLTQAQLQLDRGQLEPCLANLISLRRQAPKNTRVLRLLQQVYVQLEDWLSLIQLLPELKRQHVLDTEALNALEHQCHLQRLQQSLTTLEGDADAQQQLQALSRSWQAIPVHLQRDSELVGRYTELMREIGAEAEAEKVLLDLIKRHWDVRLVECYGLLAGQDAHQQLENAKGWLKKHPDCAELELTLGRLSMRNAHWGQAISHFERSFELDPREDTFSELQRLLHHLGETERAAQLMQTQLGRLAPGLPSLPLPEKTD
ncbi:heme biosynthesis HemY N-terminal domain-containing protein [Marinobacterium weihaiense]|uniref:Heme biosynthesis protein HemY n=1 Tax=Marinobacterium weihaiense TaxID=2851016 RepID=A0ABS6MCE3_9GAMM|nr:heme biosynthesis HemY N-terminal domain-containing protein [Marinobacterium weihaiense]MBV0933976.1 heme biosynthesis protein HemY [Marinobacterium weihaiense]